MHTHAAAVSDPPSILRSPCRDLSWSSISSSKAYCVWLREEADHSCLVAGDNDAAGAGGLLEGRRRHGKDVPQPQARSSGAVGRCQHRAGLVAKCAAKSYYVRLAHELQPRASSCVTLREYQNHAPGVVEVSGVAMPGPLQALWCNRLVCIGAAHGLSRLGSQLRRTSMVLRAQSFSPGGGGGLFDDSFQEASAPGCSVCLTGPRQQFEHRSGRIHPVHRKPSPLPAAELISRLRARHKARMRSAEDQ